MAYLAIFGFFRFRQKMEFHYRRHFRLRSKMKNAFSVGLYIKLFQITPYVNDFQKLNNAGSGQPVDAMKKSSFIIIVVSPSEPLRRSVTPGDLRSPQRR